MFTLHEAQAAMQAVLAHGPAFLSDDVYAGAPDRVLLGLKAHANTISHARLVALEQTFPRCCEALGQSAFNALSRAYLESGYGLHEPLALIGRSFAGWLDAEGADRDACVIAAFEWAWLEAFGAVDAAPLLLADISVLDEQTLLASLFDVHPAVRTLTAHPALLNLCEIGPCTSLLIARPEETVRIHGLSAGEAALLTCLASGQSLGDALSGLPGDPAARGSCFVRLVETGALIPCHSPDTGDLPC